MKTFFYLFLFITSLALASCDLNGSSNSTPQISLVTTPILNSKDSLFIHYSGQDGLLLLDTVSVGDTVSFRVFMNGYSNQLTSYSISLSDSLATKILLPSKNSLDSVFIAGSNYAIGKFIFKSNVFNLYLPIKYVALKPTNEAKISFTIKSDAVFDGGVYMGSNSVTLALKTPIKPQKVKPS
jgi:hypothetical protein